jgi:anti-sigma B factor antagonist
MNMKINPVVKVIHPSGALDGSKASELRQKIINLVEDGADIVLINFQNVSFMDSSGLGAIVLSLKTVNAAGSKLALCSLSGQLKMLFELTSMDRVFQIYENQNEFSNLLAVSK